MTPPVLDPERVARAVAAALEEDLDGAGDLTTASAIPRGRRAVGRFVARMPMVAAGVPVAREVFRQLDATLAFLERHRDGEEVERGEVLAEVSGEASPILTGERTALNFLMRMSGIATAAREAVREVEGTGARILDTRKTAPGLRQLDKYAVAAGGAENHRQGLHDGVMFKDTHLAVEPEIETAVARALAAGNPAGIITVEVRDEEQLRAAIRAGAGRALLDNMDLEMLRRCVAIGRGRIVLEASGGLRPGNLRKAAETGVDFLSLGWLTHSSPAADVAMELEALP